jgi:D-alanyl-D-alanine dipeptidase
VIAPALALLLLGSPPAPVPAPPLADAARAVPDVVLDLRYATARNVVGRPLYPAGARCLLLPPVAARLARAAELLRPQGFRLRVYDCYRPLSVQRLLFAKESRPGFVADPDRGGSHHNRGAAVDLGLAGPAGEDVELPTDFDEFTPRARADAVEGVTAPARANRKALREAMVAAGFTPSRTEWWHFSAPEARGARLLDVPVGAAGPQPSSTPPDPTVRSEAPP